MSSITIFGTGNMATAIAGVLTAGGAQVHHISHEQGAGGSIVGDTVILAVPYHAVAEITSAYAGQLEGKVVVDISNPLNFETFDSLVVPVGSSAAAEIQTALPNSKVLKAFNTNFAATLSSGKVGDAVTAVLIAGDDTDAKASLAAVIAAGGLKAVDAGSIKRAHELEAIGFLQLTLAASDKISWSGGFGLNN